MTVIPPSKKLRQALDCLYNQYNQREFVHPDPLEFLYYYTEPRDIEIAGLIASSLAYGRVQQILKSVSYVLSRLSENPGSFLVSASLPELRQLFQGFKHRFTTETDLTNLLFGIRGMVLEYSSLELAFKKAWDTAEEGLFPKRIAAALSLFNRKLLGYSGEKSGFILPDPCAGSACKRSFLFLRWMCRCDKVDPGVWQAIKSSELVVPLDTHLFKISKELGLVQRKSPDLKAAIEITDAFAGICPEDPVRYDFCLTRFGIHPELDYMALRCELEKA